MSGLFITGTDTEVGKSIVTAALAAGYRAKGRRPSAVKPLASGSAPPGEDALLISKHAGHSPRGFACLPEPASPERAAREAGVSIDDTSLIEWCRSQSGDPLLIEGVGGWAVPLTESLTVEDLAIAMALPVIIVAANRLGMLNHTLLTVEAIRESGLPIGGIVINNAFDSPSNLKEWNEADIRRWVGPATSVITIDRIDTDNQFGVVGSDIIKAFSL